MEALALLLGKKGGLVVDNGDTNPSSLRSIDLDIVNYDEVEFGKDELETERAEIQSTNHYLQKEISLATKKIEKVYEYIRSLDLDLKEGTLKRVAPTKHPVKRLDLDAISEDSDDKHSELQENKSRMNSSVDTFYKGITSTDSRAPIKHRKTKSEKELS